MINLPSLNNFLTSTNSKMEMVSLVLGSIKKGRNVLYRYEGHLHPNPDPLGFFTLPSDCLEQKVFQFKVLYFGLSTSPQVFTSVFSGVGVGSQGRDSFTLLPR